MTFYITLPKNITNDNQDKYRSIMEVRDSSYVLKEGSYIRKVARDSFNDHTYYDLWEQITKSDSVTDCENEQLYITKKDIEFGSPSGAGAIVRGGQTNGRTDWKRLDDGLPLYKCEAESLDAA